MNLWPEQGGHRDQAQPPRPQAADHTGQGAHRLRMVATVVHEDDCAGAGAGERGGADRRRPGMVVVL